MNDIEARLSEINKLDWQHDRELWRERSNLVMDYMFDVGDTPWYLGVKRMLRGLIGNDRVSLAYLIQECRKYGIGRRKVIHVLTVDGEFNCIQKKSCQKYYTYTNCKKIY